MSEATGWSTTLVGHMPRGERETTRELIELAIPILWEIGGTERFRHTDDGFHVTAFRVGGVPRYLTFGDFFYESRGITLDLGLIRGNLGARWRRYTLAILAHEMAHARQFLRAPRTYHKKHPWSFPTYSEYWNSPGEIEARREESLVRVALGLSAIAPPARGKRREKLEAYRQAFNQEILPCLRALETNGRENAGLPGNSMSLLARDKDEMLEDLRQYIGRRRANRLDANGAERAAKLWRYARGWHIEEALLGRTAEQKTAWLQNGGVRRHIRAHLAHHLPEAAEDMARHDWRQPFHRHLKAWDQTLLEGYTALLKGRLAGLEQIYRQAEAA